MTWNRSEAEQAAWEEDHVWEAELECLGCHESFRGEVLDGEPAQGCPECGAGPEEVARVGP